MKMCKYRKKVLSMRKGRVGKHAANKVLQNLEDAVVAVMGYDLHVLKYFAHWILRAEAKLAKGFNIKASHHNLMLSTKRGCYFVALMGLGMCKLLRPILGDSKPAKIVYIFDVWEPQFNCWYEEMKHWKNVHIVYFAFKQSNEYFRNKFQFGTEWMPQAIDIKKFYEFRNIKKARLIVQVGRKDKDLHTFFLRFAQKYSMDYIYEKEKGEVIAPQRRDYIKLISKASIFVISPQNFDYQKKTGSVSTVTAKYYEGYASSSLVVGKKTSSDEFDLLFKGYPFVEYKKDEAQFEQEILSMLEEKVDVFELIERDHTWNKRVEMFMVEKCR